MRHLDVAPLQAAVDEILLRALAGYLPDYKVEHEGVLFVQWERVRQDIAGTIATFGRQAAQADEEL